MRKRSGSENRKRPKTYSFRMSEDELAKAAAIRDHTGHSLADYIRHKIFDTPLPRAARRPTVNHRAVAQLLGQLGKIGSNINQAQKHMNAGHPQWNVWEEGVRALIEMRTACMEALGREPDRNHPPS